MRHPAIRPLHAVPALLAILLAAVPASAVILKLTPLKDVLEGEQFIFSATIDSIAPEKPGVVLKFEEKLKGDAPFERLAVNLTGDDEAKKDDHTKKLLERLDKDRKVIVFASKKGKKFNAMAFVEGTWFSLQGTLDDDGKTVRWQFLHCEPYLRRTYAGTTADLKKIIQDGLAKKAEPPGVNEKEKPGLGPPSMKKCSSLSTQHSSLFGVMPSLILVGPLAIIAAPTATIEALPSELRPVVVRSPDRATATIEGLPSELRPVVVRSPDRATATTEGLPSEQIGRRPAVEQVARSGDRATTWIEQVARSGDRGTTRVARSGDRGTTPGSTPLFGVMPSLILVGPLAIIAALFPGVAARMAVGMKRWRAFLVVASTNSTLALIYWLLAFKQWLPDTWLAGYKPFTALLLVFNGIGLLWAGLRYRRMGSGNTAFTAIPARNELAILSGLTLLVGLIAASARLFGDSWNETIDLPMREFTLIGFSLLVATLYTAYRMATANSDQTFEGTEPAPRLSLSGESVGLGTLFLCGVIALCIGGNATQHAIAITSEVGDADDTIGPKLADVRVFEIPDVHQVMSNGISVDGDRIYFGAVKPGFSSSFGSVFCLDRNSGKVHWKFDNDEDMNPVFCTPTVFEGKVYVGEGLHTDKKCRLFCLDALSGKPAWAKPFETSSHTEGNPRIASGKVYFTAGDDGLFCADAKTGEKTWQFPGRDQQLHIDGPPAVSGNRVFIGSGLYTLALLGVDATNGKELWRTPVNLRSFGPPLVLGNRVVYGLGTGNMGADVFKYDEEKGKDEEKTPAGAIVCVDAETGKLAWQYDLTRSVHTSLAADAFSIYAASRDGAVHCLDRKTGKLRWKTGIGATFTSGPAVAASGGMPVAVYAITTEGTMVCLNSQNGKVCWIRDLREHTKRSVEEAYTTPTVVMESTPTGSRRVIYTGAMLKNPNNGAKAAAVFRFEDEIE